MPQGARQAMVMLTQSMFAYHGKVDPMDKHVTHMSQQMASSTPLQVAIFFICGHRSNRQIRNIN